jgi:two-component system cell cycle sensor histidine kinase/response regulator CckA
MLRKRNYTVHEAPDGLTAVEIFKSGAGAIDVVVLDMTLPGISGVQVLEEVRKIRSDVRVVLTSAYGREMAVSRVPQGEAFEYIRKPYRIADLLELLEQKR